MPGYTFAGNPGPFNSEATHFACGLWMFCCSEVVAVVTDESLRFIDSDALPKDVILFTDSEKWSAWKRSRDSVLRSLRNWADVMVIVSLSANTLEKIANGLSDDVLTCIVEAWDFRKPFFLAPAMTPCMWKDPSTERHVIAIDEMGISIILPLTTRLPTEESGRAPMAEASAILSAVRLAVEEKGAQ